MCLEVVLILALNLQTNRLFSGIPGLPSGSGNTVVHVLCTRKHMAGRGQSLAGRGQSLLCPCESTPPGLGVWLEMASKAFVFVWMNPSSSSLARKEYRVSRGRRGRKDCSVSLGLSPATRESLTGAGCCSWTDSCPQSGAGHGPALSQPASPPCPRFSLLVRQLWSCEQRAGQAELVVQLWQGASAVAHSPFQL